MMIQRTIGQSKRTQARTSSLHMAPLSPENRTFLLKLIELAENWGAARPRPALAAPAPPKNYYLRSI